MKKINLTYYISFYMTAYIKFNSNPSLPCNLHIKLSHRNIKQSFNGINSSFSPKISQEPNKHSIATKSNLKNYVMNGEELHSQQEIENSTVPYQQSC